MIIGTALGGLALWNNKERGFGGCGAPMATAAIAGGAMYLERKECQDVVDLTSAIYQGRITELNERFADRQTINGEMFGLYKSQIDADFGLYKNQRDQFDVLKAEIDGLKTHVAVNDAVLPYQMKLLQNEIACCCKESNWKLNLEAERRCCADQRIVSYANGTFATQGVATPTFSTTVVPKTTFNPLCCGCEIDCNCNNGL